MSRTVIEPVAHMTKTTRAAWELIEISWQAKRMFRRLIDQQSIVGFPRPSNASIADQIVQSPGRERSTCRLSGQKGIQVLAQTRHRSSPNARTRSVVSVKQLQFRRTDQSRVTAQHYLEQRRTGFWGTGDPLIACDEMPRNQISWKRFSFFCEFTVAYVPGHSRRVGSVDAFQR